ncbi:DUF924 family protein [Paraburkholderia phenazinium]|jgi:uncharacterized protein (DUF924 family)|uniref:Uncharacterized conserved protein, DUF924 family n=1 Tax=Paraburkholderia phenazinium TaxID=60549 RepID=A0A1G8F749_9BURK|nr:DUF924 family protein [Paraburkholderia phenazinium]SDH77927.1 Uncharacterized conserved protein, DUF924 family [Paraburkholderia phenazinium]
MSGLSGPAAYDVAEDYAALDALARAVLDCWFGTPGSATYGHDRKAWFARDAAFDAMLHERFGVLHAAALQGDLDAWTCTPLGALALVIVLDQFSRNLYRGTARAFAADGQALRITRQMVETGADLLLPDLFHRAFAYLPFEHDETAASQHEAVRLFKPFEAEPAGASYYRSALRHAGVIERFGRFPHRNVLLGRPSTEEELVFLRKPGSSF